MEVILKNISYSYSKVNYKQKEIFNKISLKFDKGKITSILGNVGSGKSTLLQIIGTNLIPEGEMFFDKVVINENLILNNFRDIQSKIGFSFSDYLEDTYEETVFDALKFILNYHCYKLDKINERVSASLKMVGLDDRYYSRKINSLSSGELKKISIASALIHNPKIILLDDPTVGLDLTSKLELLKLLRILKNRFNKTIIVATNDIDFIHKITDYIYVLDHGKIEIEGTKYDVFKNESKLRKLGINIPKVMEFSNVVLSKKNIKIGYRDEINDLIKDIYRFVS
ncbi:MAG: energy-coupling factor ABC transporter ATP-binding protein [Bacilli bacterium]